MKKQIPKKLSLLFIAVLLTAGFFAAVFPVGGKYPVAEAATIDQLRAQANALQAQIDANNAEAKRLAGEADSLKKTVAEFDLQIASIDNQINLIDVKLQQLALDLIKAQQELDRQKALLKASLQALYKRGGASTVELLVGSDSFSQFINGQTYLEKLKSGIQDSTTKVIELKQQIQTQQAEQAQLKKQQEDARTTAANSRSERQQLLNKTQGEEAKYNNLVNELKKQKSEADAALARSIGSGSYRTAPVGAVSAGDIVGGIGNSGLSSGPHLHLEVRQGGSTRNPDNYIQHQPVAMPPAWVSQGYWQADPIYYSGHHPGVDYAGPAGMAISAIDSGYMYRGCSDDLLKTNNNAYGYVAIVEHSNGAISIYAHMSGGPSDCNYNTYW